MNNQRTFGVLFLLLVPFIGIVMVSLVKSFLTLSKDGEKESTSRKKSYFSNKTRLYVLLITLLMVNEGPDPYKVDTSIFSKVGTYSSKTRLTSARKGLW